MFFRKLIGFAFIAMLFVGAMSLFGMGRGRTQDAWTQGYIAGQQSVTTNADDMSTVPLAPANSYANHNEFGYGRSHFGFFPGFGLLFCLIPLFFFGGLFMLFGGRHRMGMGRRRHWCRPGHWQHHDHEKYKGTKPPWVDDDLADEPIMKA